MESSGNYFKKYQREHRIQTTEENFTKGIKFEQTPLDTGEHKLIVNYDMLNDGLVITPRKGIRVNEIALPLTTPDLYSRITSDMLLTNNLDAIEEDGTHYRLFIANQCSESTVGLHSGPAELWVEDKDIATTYPMVSEYGIESRDMYAIPVSYEIDSIKNENLDEDNYDDFFTINKLDYNANLGDGVLQIDTAYNGGFCFKVNAHPFVLTFVGATGTFTLYKAQKTVSGWEPISGTGTVITTSVSLLAKTDYYILPTNPGADLPDDNPYITKATTVSQATVDYVDIDETFISGSRVYTYRKGTATAVVNAIGATAKVNTLKFFKYIKTAGTHTFTYLLNTIDYATTVLGATLTIDRTKYNRVQTTTGTISFIYIKNKHDSTTCSTSGASIELDIYRFNRMKPTAGTYTFTYSSADNSWKIDNTNIFLQDYGILFKDPNGALANGATIKIVTSSKEKWLLDDNYVVLGDYGITFTQGTTAPQDGDMINVKSVAAGTWLYNNEYVSITDYGIEITDVKSKIRDGDTMVVTSTAATGWLRDSNLVELSEEGVFLTDENNLVADNDTITITKLAKSFTNLTFGNAKMETPGSMYYIPADANGNGFPLTNKRAAKAIGCFAWNNNYYNFNSHGELIRSRYQVADASSGITKTYYTEAITPKTINASEAVSSGFNMLSESPYTFEDSFEEGDIHLQGIMLYDNADLITEPVLNTPYTLRCFYNVDKNTRYKIVWTYREINTSDWIDIKKEEYIFGSEDDIPEALIVDAFSSPIENCVVKVQAYKWDKEPVVSYSTSVANASVVINTSEIEKMFTESGKYTFIYDGSNWTYLGKVTTLSTYGITYSDVTSGLTAGSTLTITMEYKEQFSETVEDSITMSVTYSAAPSSTTANKELKNYDLSKCTGMVYWKGHIWLYGLKEDPTVLFASDVNEPTYFPYPNNVDIFSEPILFCAPFNDNMLLFTRSTLYKLTLTEDGFWTTSTIQTDLNFTEFDINTIRIVKNMVFFKSGNYYYMVVPKTLSLQNELAIAPVSKNIEKFLDNFVDNITDLFSILYEYSGTINLVAHYNFLNYEDVHNVYTFQLSSGILVNVELLYNTVDRYWRFYTYESQELYRPLRQDATKQCQFYAPLHGKFNIDGVQTNVLGVQLLESEETMNKDFYIPTGSVFNKVNGVWKADNGVIAAAFNTQHVFKNYTLLDCGYRNIITDYKKRCRELQFKFNNVGKRSVTFYTEFILDGETRIGYYKYSTEHIIDPTNPKFGYIYIDKTPVENLDIPGATMLGEASTDINSWALDYSRFPEIAFWKARLKVSGKGYTPRFRLLSKTEENYELIGYSWVYRALYSR